MSVIRNLQFISFKDLDQISGSFTLHIARSGPHIPLVQLNPCIQSKQMHFKSEKDVDYLSFH